jgi:acetyl esterase/lipase
VTARLDPQAQALLDVVAALGLAPINSLPVREARQRTRTALIRRGEPLALASVEEALVPTPGGPRAMRIYRPGAGLAPVALFFHGGGWTINDLDTHDELCRRLAQRSGWIFAALDYRRAPEHKHPAALEDAYHAYRWVLDNQERLAGDGRCAVVGESSGGTMAAALTLLLRDGGAPIPDFQAIAYPLLDRLGNWPSYERYASGYTLDRAQIEWYLGHVMPTRGDGELDEAYLLPMLAADLSGLPPTLVMTAEFDPLRDEGVVFVERLADAGVTVEHVHAADQMHGFLMLGGVLAGAGRLVDRLADALAARNAERVA